MFKWIEDHVLIFVILGLVILAALGLKITEQGRQIKDLQVRECRHANVALRQSNVARLAFWRHLTRTAEHSKELARLEVGEHRRLRYVFAREERQLASTLMWLPRKNCVRAERDSVYRPRAPLHFTSANRTTAPE